MAQGCYLQLWLHLLRRSRNPYRVAQLSFLVTQRSLRQRWAGGHNRFAVISHFRGLAFRCRQSVRNFRYKSRAGRHNCFAVLGGFP